jgi:N-acetylneuraminate epimerase
MWICRLTVAGIAACVVMQGGSLHAQVPAKGAMEIRWRQINDLPIREGVAGAFAGVSGTSVLAAGGANFPDEPPWKGGQKVWHDRVWLLKDTTAPWQEIGKLPSVLGYGVSIGTQDGLICIGGSDSMRHHADVFRIKLDCEKLMYEELPALPRAIANACGALVGQTIFVAGGLPAPDATTTLRAFYSMDLSDKVLSWTELDPWPGSGRMLAVAAAMEDRFYLISGVDLAPGPDGKPVRSYLKDAYCFQPNVGWTQIADLPQSVAAAPSPAYSLNDHSLLIFGGDDGTSVGVTPPDSHPGFSRKIYRYNASLNTWTDEGRCPMGHVTTTIVQIANRAIIVSGEIRPAVRSPAVWSVESQR